MYYTTSKGILDLDYLPELSGLASEVKFCKKPIKGAKGYVGWGRKPSGQKAKLFADQSGSAYISLEDGFLKNLPHMGDTTLSLVTDFTGVHYDATCPSDLESLLNEMIASDEQLMRSDLFIKRLNHLGLLKYGPQADSGSFAEYENQPCVLLIDQLKDDCSISYGMANEQSFEQMLEFARTTFPDHKILVKPHPMADGRSKVGCIDKSWLKHGEALLSQDVSLDTALQVADRVFVVTSQAGFDALLRGKDVWCFGAPFYAGWGLTHDFVAVKRRVAKHSIQSLAYFCFFEYSRFVDPTLGQVCSPEEFLDLAESAINQVCLEQASYFGFKLWKQETIKRFTGIQGKPEFHSKFPSPKKLPLIAQPFVMWSSNVLCTADDEFQKVYVEDGFIRSAALGSDLTEPYSLCIDFSAPYYDPTRPSDLEIMISKTQLNQDQRWRIQGLIEMILESNISKYNFKVDPVLTQTRYTQLQEQANGRKLILIPGQVEDDASILRGCGKLNTLEQLIEKVRFDYPHAYIVYRPHPDVLAGNRKGLLNHPKIDWVETGIPTTHLLDACDEVHTLTSLTGFEALLRRKTVHCYGQPFYAGWGLTHDHYRARHRLRPSATLAELAYCALIAYPKYRDVQTGLPISPEVAILRIQQDLNQNKNKIRKQTRQVTRALRYLTLGFKQWV